MAVNYGIYSDEVEQLEGKDDIDKPANGNGKRENGNGTAIEYGKGKTEVMIPNDPPLRLWLEAEVYEGDEPSNCIINGDKEWSVRVHWHLDGALKNFICGYWCLYLHFEAMGEGKDFSVAYPDDHIELDPCCGHEYWAEFPVKPGTITPAHCSTPYKLVLSLTYLDPCHKKGPMAGHVELPMLQFYQTH